MERIITLLREKVHYLEKFYELNEREILHFSSGNFDNIESFYQTRDKILDLVKCIDDLLREENERTVTFDPVGTGTEREMVEALLNQKSELVPKILAQDLQIISWIDREKSSIIRELQVVRKGRKVMQGYHSGGSAPLLDEKA